MSFILDPEMSITEDRFKDFFPRNLRFQELEVEKQFELMKTQLKLVKSSNRSGDIYNQSCSYTKRNNSGVIIHPIFIRPFQWGDNYYKWSLEESESYANKVLKPLKFVKDLMILSAMIKNGSSLRRSKLYPFEFKHGDIIKLAIIDSGNFKYEAFHKNDGCYIISTFVNDLGDDELGVFPLDNRFNTEGAVLPNIKFDGINTFPDAYECIIHKNNICYADENIIDKFIEGLSSEMIYRAKHYYLQSKFSIGDCHFIFSAPIEQVFPYLSLTELKKTVKANINPLMRCKYVGSSKNTYILTIISRVLPDNYFDLVKRTRKNLRSNDLNKEKPYPKSVQEEHSLQFEFDELSISMFA